MKATEAIEQEVTLILVRKITRQGDGDARHRLSMATRDDHTELFDMAAIPRMVRGEGAVGREDSTLAPLKEWPMQFEHPRLREDRVEPIAEIETEHSMALMRRPHVW